ncbi:MAG: Sua5/YciO/YrdC/YwlC family protein, partial [Treponema sp.]|nr:Sua5/YciO/YrdC/YwlC family protein [Treponema sp.]
MEVLSCSDNDLEKAASALAAGLLVAFPTETVYGLGADAFNLSALARIFEAKNRPRFDPLIIHIAEMITLNRIADTASLSGASKEKLSLLSEKLWPGPLT